MIQVYDVIISGAGPVGLFLGCELALAGCSVLILEKTAETSSPVKQIPFGIRGLSALSVEALDRRGLLPELALHKQMKSPHMHAGEGARRQLGHFAGIAFFEGDIDTSQWKYRLPSSTPTHLISSMAEMETVLGSRAQALGVHIKRGLPVTGFQQTESGVTVESEHQSFEGRWLVGCDGARSIVRKASGIEFAGTEPAFTGYSTRVDIADPEKLKPGRNVTSRGMYMQSQPGYVVIQDFDGGAFHGSERPITLEHVQAVLRRISDTDVTLTALHFASAWTDRARQATAYRKGRIFLCGDAAHIHSPLGGQGLNLGLGDAMNLGWKLAATIHKTAPEGLLDTYFSERHPIGVQVLDWSRAQVAIMKTDPEARALYAIFRDLMKTRDGTTYVAGKVWGLATAYDLGGAHPLVGHSVPNFAFDDGRTLADFMHQGQGILLDFARSGYLEELAQGYGERIRYIPQHALESFGMSALLIRPDGFIAWAAAGTPDERSIREALARWFA